MAAHDSPVPRRDRIARALLFGWGPPLVVLVNLRFPGLRLEWAWGNVLCFFAAMIPPFVVMMRSARWPPGTRRGITMAFVAPAALLALVSCGCAVVDLSLNGPAQACEARFAARYAATDAVANRCCEGGVLGECAVQADQIWHVLPGLRVQRTLGGVVRANDVSDAKLAGDVLEFTATAPGGSRQVVRVRLKRWVWL